MSGGNQSQSSSPEKPLRAEYPLEPLSPGYRDEDPERTRGIRTSTDQHDLELGNNVPLLATDSYNRTGRTSDGSDDYDDFTRHESRLDPRFSCSPSGFCAWLRGPVPPHVYHIKPWIPQLHTAPLRLVDRWAPRRKTKVGLLVGGLLFWVIVFFWSVQSSVAGQEVPGYGQPVKLSCHQRLWNNATDCGLNGELCQPFDEQSFAFRCPAGCAAAILLEPYYVGGQEVNYRPLVIGGKPFRRDGRMSGVYRGDSSICASALHAGLINDARGGCAILHRRGERTRFETAILNGIESIEFLGHFPLSFALTRETTSSGTSDAKIAECSDNRWSLFTFTVLLTTILSMTVTSAPLFYSVIYFIVWFQVAMASDPPTSGYYELVSIGLGRFLPGAFVGFALYYFCVRHTLNNLEAHLDKTILWLGGCWVGALNTDTFDRIPISRLTPHDLKQQPGATTALIIILIFLVVVFLIQAHAFRREGRLLKQLRLYGILTLGILVLVVVPHMNLRIHHYILALLLLPGTTVQTRPSLLFQGVLIGLFINGIARWGFDSILQTPASLLEGGRLGTPPPAIKPPALVDGNNLVFSFPDLPANVDGVSVVINDVERFHGLKERDSGIVPDFTWARRFPKEVEYFRFAYIHLNALGGVWYEDLSASSSWEADGNYFYPG